MIKKKPVTTLLQQKVKLIITQEVEDKIQYLCRCLPTVEWSGTLFYKVTSGSIDQDINNLTMETVDLYLQDIGQGAHTQFSVSDDILDLYAHNPELENCKQAILHSHNSMGVFFSGEDMSELEDNYELYDFFLSLIVNNSGDRLAKIAIPVITITKSISTLTSRTIIKNSEGLNVETINEPVEKESETEEYMMIIADVDITCPVSILAMEQFFVDRFNTLNKPKTSYNPPVYQHLLYNSGYNRKDENYYGRNSNTFEKAFNNDNDVNNYLEKNNKRKEYKDYFKNNKTIYHDHKGIIQFGILMFTLGRVKDGTLRSQLENIDNITKNVLIYVSTAFAKLNENYKKAFGTNPKPDELCDAIEELNNIYNETCRTIKSTTIASDALMNKLIETSDTIDTIKNDNVDNKTVNNVSNEQWENYYNQFD